MLGLNNAKKKALKEAGYQNVDQLHGKYLRSAYNLYLRNFSHGLIQELINKDTGNT